MTVWDVFKLVGMIAIWIGVAFSALGVVGLIRLPDVYSRLHATSKVSTLGLLGLLVGVILITGGSAALKAVALGIFMLITGPMAGHAIASAAYRFGCPLEPNHIRDDLAALPDEVRTAADQSLAELPHH